MTTPPAAVRPATFTHPARIALAAVAALVVSYAVAVQDPVPAWELRLTEWVNAAPDWLAAVLYPVMQLGTVWAPVAVGLLILAARRDALLGAAAVVTGVVAWFVAKGVKAMVERGRPLVYLPGVDVREGAGTGLGYVSGHSAVAAATAMVAMAALPRRWWPLPLALAATVGVARIVYGVHLPADVVGGWALGVLLGLAGVTVVDRLRPPAPVVAAEEETR